MKKLAMCLAVFGCLSISSVAFADEAAPAETQSMRGVITVPRVDITSHYMRPQASIAVSRVDTRLTLVELKQLFLQRIEQSVLKGAF